MGRPDAKSRAHWDNEPVGRTSSAGPQVKARFAASWNSALRTKSFTGSRISQLLGLAVLAVVAGGCGDPVKPVSPDTNSGRETAAAQSSPTPKAPSEGEAAAKAPDDSPRVVPRPSATASQTPPRTASQAPSKPTGNAFPSLPTLDPMNRELRRQGRQLLAGTDPSWAPLSKKLAARCVALDALLAGRARERKEVIAGLEALNVGQDAKALQRLAALAAGDLTVEQANVAGEIRDLAGALAVGRNFPEAASGEGAAAVVANCLLNRQPDAAAVAARELIQEPTPTLTAPQLALLSQIAVSSAP